MTDTSEVLVVGAGVFGLATAWALAARGLSVTVIEKGRPGEGSSGGPVGAITPHMPERWSAFKQFQFEALVRLSEVIEQLNAQSGIDSGYARVGRLTPLLTERERSRAIENHAAAHDRWAGQGVYDLLEEPPAVASAWLSTECYPAGLVYDTLSARIRPSSHLQALTVAFLRNGGRLQTGEAVLDLDHANATVRTGCDTYTANWIVVAAGWQSFDLLGIESKGVRGQAALLSGCPAPGVPLIYRDGLYVVPHADGCVGLGSTSERDWESNETDTRLDELIERAREICLPLRRAEVLDRWSGIRPKAPGREPIVGALPGAPQVLIASGGYKIGFGVAHLVAEVVACMISGEPVPVALPEGFHPDAHLRKAGA